MTGRKPARQVKRGSRYTKKTNWRHKMDPELEAAMISIYYKAGHATGYWANRFLQKVRKDRGLPAAHQWLKPEKRGRFYS
jgi:hypothetical protein